MSSSKVRKVKRTVYFTATWLANVLTVTTSAVHDAITGDIVTLNSPNSPQEIRATITVTSTTEFTITASDQFSSFLLGIASFDFIRSATSQVITAPNSSGGLGVIQATVSGTNGATTLVYGSLDGVNFVTTALGTLTNTTGNSVFLSIPNNWAYLKLDTTAVGAATKLQLWYSA